MSAGLVIRGLRASHGSREILRGVDLTVAPGEICALMGVSGAGKSTVLRAVAALQPFSAGSIGVGDFALHPALSAVPPNHAATRPVRVSAIVDACALANGAVSKMNSVRMTAGRCPDAEDEATIDKVARPRRMAFMWGGRIRSLARSSCTGKA